MKTTVRGICLNLNESEYYFKYKGLIFYFSSDFYKKRFSEKVEEYVLNEGLKIQVKYDLNLNFEVVFMLSLYKKIEKRGFRVFDEVNKKEITPSCGIISSIIMY